jgi:hypothetical protein
MRRVAWACAACTAVIALSAGSAFAVGNGASVSARSTPKWKVVRSVRGGFALGVPGGWTVIPPDKSMPGVVLSAVDKKESTQGGGPLGALMVVVPGSGRSLSSLSAMVLRAVHKRPVVGPIEKSRVRLPAGLAEVLRFRVRAQGIDAAFSDYALVVHGTSVMISFSAPYARADAYHTTFVRSANSFRAGG